MLVHRHDAVAVVAVVAGQRPGVDVVVAVGGAVGGFLYLLFHFSMAVWGKLRSTSNAILGVLKVSLFAVGCQISLQAGWNSRK